MVVVLFVIFSCFCTFISSFKIASFNVRYGSAEEVNSHNLWENRKEIFSRTIKQLGNGEIDIIAIQEGLNFQVDHISKLMGDGWKKIGKPRYCLDDPRVKKKKDKNINYTNEENSIFFNEKKFNLIKEYNFWHSETPEQCSSMNWENVLPRLTTIGVFEDIETKQKFAVFNTHLSHCVHPSSVYSRKVAELINAKIKELDLPVILTGDFNQDSKQEKVRNSNPYKKWIKDTELVDAWNYLFNEDSQKMKQGTFNPSFTNHFNGKRIDWFLTSSSINIIDMQIDHYNEESKFPSDHFPIVLHFAIEKKEVEFGDEL